MSRLSISSSFLVYCHLRCSLDGNLVKSCLVECTQCATPGTRASTVKSETSRMMRLIPSVPRSVAARTAASASTRRVAASLATGGPTVRKRRSNAAAIRARTEGRVATNSTDTSVTVDRVGCISSALYCYIVSCTACNVQCTFLKTAYSL